MSTAMLKTINKQLQDFYLVDNIANRQLKVKLIEQSLDMLLTWAVSTILAISIAVKEVTKCNNVSPFFSSNAQTQQNSSHEMFKVIVSARQI